MLTAYTRRPNNIGYVGIFFGLNLAIGGGNYKKQHKTTIIFKIDSNKRD